jgi:hypothetical protein
MDPMLIMTILGLALILSALAGGAFYLWERRSENRRLKRRCRDLERDGIRISK